MSDAVIYSANFGGFDHDRPRENWPMLNFNGSAAQGRRGAKRVKIMGPQESPWLENFSKLIWLDGNLTIKDEGFVPWILEQLGDAPIALWKHSYRDNLAQEVEASTRMSKYDGQDIRGQVEDYISRGYPDHADTPLWACAAFAINRGPECDELMRRWWKEMEWSLQDQISLSYLTWEMGIEPVVLEGFPAGSPEPCRWLELRPHAKPD